MVMGFKVLSAEGIALYHANEKSFIYMGSEFIPFSYVETHFSIHLEFFNKEQNFLMDINQQIFLQMTLYCSYIHDMKLYSLMVQGFQ